MGTLDTLVKLTEEESWTPLRTSWEDTDDEYLARTLRMSAARCSMASWALPFEAIVSVMLIDHVRRKP